MTSISFFKRVLVLLYECFSLLAIYFFTAGPVTYFFKIIYDPNIPVIHQGKYLSLLCFIIFVFFIYFSFCWTKGGQTLAMKAWRCKLVDASGGNITLHQAVIRYASALVSWLPFGSGFLLSIVRQDRATLHDLLSRSYIIDTNSSSGKTARKNQNPNNVL